MGHPSISAHPTQTEATHGMEGSGSGADGYATGRFLSRRACAQAHRCPTFGNQRYNLSAQPPRPFREIGRGWKGRSLTERPSSTWQ